MLCGCYGCVARAVNPATDVLHLRRGRADLGRRRAMADGHEFSGPCLLSLLVALVLPRRQERAQGAAECLALQKKG